MPSLWDVNQERKAKFKTLDNDYAMFSIGCRVKIICVWEDFYFFDGDEMGTVTDNSGEYLGIIVKFDQPRKFENGYIQYDFNFAPDDLVVVENKEENKFLLLIKSND